MNITSCENCGVVLDLDMLDFPEDTWDEEKEEQDLSKCVWTGDGFSAIVPCPVCKSPIQETK